MRPETTTKTLLLVAAAILGTAEGVTADDSAPPPAVLTSEEVPVADNRLEGNLPWLGKVALPGIPVRWDDRVIDTIEYLRAHRRGRAIMEAWLRRERREGPRIRRTLRDMGLPEDLVYIAMIESGFDPRARSHAAAVGTWQFVSTTGAQYGLTQNHWVDERMDPVKATRAAGTYLADLYAKFGTWELAFAAYNMGQGALLRAMRKYNTNDYWLLCRLEAGLPYQTVSYVAKAMAVAVIGTNATLFGFEGLEAEKPTATDVVRVRGGIPLAQLARALPVSADELEAQNPELKRRRTPPGVRSYPLHVPAGTAAGFHERWARIRPTQPGHRVHIMRFGESLEEAAKRYRTSARALRRLNELDPGASPSVGFPLLVPAVDPREDEAPEEPVVVAVPRDVPTYDDRRRVFFRVEDEAEPREVAEKFGVPVDELLAWNHVDLEATLQSGMVLQLFVPKDASLDDVVALEEDQVRLLVVGSEEFLTHHEHGKGRARFRYVVRAGDTLSSLSRRFGLSVGDIARINRVSPRTTLRVGQELVLYASRDRAPRARASRR